MPVTDRYRSVKTQFPYFRAGKSLRCKFTWNRLRLCLNLHLGLVASRFLSCSPYSLVGSPWSRSWTNHLLMIPISGWVSGDQIHINNRPECKSGDAHFSSYLEHPTWKEKSQYFQILLPMIKNWIRWNGMTLLATILWDCPSIATESFCSGLSTAQGESWKTWHP